ncbi:MAG: His/Gly/Thr/Pro-type tRNA ligase C-terminal domain-containing protein [Flavobacteriia bacterium]|nr:His/Gly/Thr/Pro-type tRNA ligase C-terminal domain-containing protein [Flavobacteriia bacterium]
MVATETLTTGTVTIRERDSMAQERVAIGELPRIVGEKVDLRGLLRKL